jgi:hypothetical protein
MLKKFAKSFHKNASLLSAVQLHGILIAHICNDNISYVLMNVSKSSCY